ncbi:methyl-accepting chemotaxis protein [Paenibacillus silviterrae]|uniref:methyl-accepting chemotaxis protein n=1 Tax=Paenibacillus silviterrae TaxID=3242194 RepID=UPI00254316B0|nr:methyl-accepting chemotaxis protein [Paenibacillus chinjuensis]
MNLQLNNKGADNMKLADWKLGTKLLVLYGITLLALILSVGVALAAMNHVTGKLIQTLYEEGYQASSLILRADKDLYQQMLNQRTIVFSDLPNERYLQEMEHYKSNLGNIRSRILEGEEIFGKNRAKYENILTEKSHKNVFDNIADFFRQFDQWEQSTTGLVEKASLLPIKERQQIVNEIVQYDEQFEAARNSLKEIRYLMDALLLEEVERSYLLIRDAQYAILSIAVLLFLIVFILGWRLVRYMVHSIHQIVNVSGLVSRGNINVGRIEIRNNDELGLLAGSVNTMTDSLKHLFQTASESAALLASSSEELLAIAVEGDLTAEKIREDSTVISEGSKRQNEMVTKTVEAIKDMSDRIAVIESNSGVVFCSSEETLLASHNGFASAQSVMEQMKEIDDAITDTSNIINQLGNQSEKIQGILQTINEIASQTKLLALNAAIEAARAGEHGKGFAVVAEEVKKLAEHSALSTQLVSDVILDIRLQTQFAVNAMKMATEKAQVGKIKSEQIISVLGSIRDKAGNVTEKVTSMYESLERMKRESDNISRATEEVKRVVDETTQYNLNNDKRINQQASLVRELSGSARSLADIAEHMDQMLTKYC